MESDSCHICQKSTDLNQFNCNHKICSLCLHILILLNPIETIDLNNKIDLICNLCPNGSLTIDKDNLINKLNYSKNSNIYCSIHLKEGYEMYCNECSKYLCFKCLNDHLKKFNLKHKLTKINEKNIFCIIHKKEENKFFCIKCNLTTCGICKNDFHNKHKVISYKEYTNHMMTKAKKEFPFINENQIDSFIEKNINKIKIELDANHNKFLSFTNKLINELNVIVQDYDIKYKKLIHEIDRTETILKLSYNNYLNNLNNNKFFADISILNEYMIYNNLPISRLENLFEEFKSFYNSNFIYKVVKKNDDLIDLKIKNIKCVKTLEGHNSNILTLIQLKDGNIASGSADNSIKIWNSSEFYCTHTLIGHKSYVIALIQLIDGKLVSGSFDNTIKVWDNNNNYNCIYTLNRHSDYVYSLIQLKDGKIASGSFDSTIKIWDPDNEFKCIYNLNGHTNGIRMLMELNDGILVSGSGDMTIKLWK